MPAISTTPRPAPPRASASELAAELRTRVLDYVHDQHADGATVVRIDVLNHILMGPALRPYTVRNRRNAS